MKNKRTNASNMNAWETDRLRRTDTFPFSSYISLFRKSFASVCHDLKAKANSSIMAENDISKK